VRALAVLVLLAAPAAAEDVVLVSDPAALAELEGRGFTLGERLGQEAASDAATLARGGRYRAMVERLERELDAIRRADPRAGVGVARHAHRLFDRRWLRAPEVRWQLIGVANRIDKKPLVARGCGDTRFLYRLAYRRPEAASRLPMTLVAIYRAVDDCREAARRWRAPDLRSPAGPLAPELVDPARLVAVQVNLQSVRWPSAVRPDLAAHAEYLLRAFRPRGDLLEPMPLENTPDVARLRRDRRLREELLAWIGANLDAIDAGGYQLPERFLTERSVSVSPRGLARRANRPFLQLFRPAEVAGLPLAGRRHIGSPAALLRRLDDGSCAGCHQARSVAGFHFLGVDGPDAAAGNALAVPFSPHLAVELPRRRALSAAFADGGDPDLARPFSDRDERGGHGAHCGRDPGFAAWTCAEGLVCDVHDAPAGDDAVGVCLPPRPGTGDPCEVGRVIAHADPHRDRVARPARRPCAGDAVCNRNAVGFPGGMCTASCDDPGPGGTCGQIAVLRGFNDCLARREPFPTCLAENVRPAGLRACDAARPCRDDYLCVRTGEGNGACIPPYFLFQMRVDGHP
jgi:hypothetical protein